MATEQEIYDLLMDSDLEEEDCFEDINEATGNPQQVPYDDEIFIEEPRKHRLADITEGEEYGECDGVEASSGNNTDITFIITEKGKIEWRRREFLPSEILFENKGESELDKLKTPYEYFSKYFTEDLYQIFAFHTNLYMQQKDIRNNKPTDPGEIKKLFALHILMGCLKFSRLRLYWNPLLGIDPFINNMSCDRFSQLRNNLHCVNNLDIPVGNTDKFIKVRPVIEAVRQHCLSIPVEETICVDEQIIPFKGHLSTKQYMRGKPNPWGIKVYVLCGKSGIPYDFLLYQGSTTGLNQDYLSAYGFGPATILKLTERLTVRGHKLFCDNFFTTYQLLEVLKQKGINGAGTVRINRFGKNFLLSDKELKEKGRGSYDQLVSRNGDIALVKWFDTKSVHLASNFVGVGTTDTTERWNKKIKKYETVKRPEIIQKYNMGMGGVDCLDQLISYYRIFVKSRKWCLTVFTHFLDFSMASAWLEYCRDAKQMGSEKKEILDLLNFRIEVANVLLYAGQPMDKKKRGRPSTSTQGSPSESPCSTPVSSRRRMEVRPLTNIRFDGLDHLPEHDQKKEATRCKMDCKTSNGTAGRTHFTCQKCKVHLCITRDRNCFAEFHRE